MHRALAVFGVMCAVAVLVSGPAGADPRDGAPVGVPLPPPVPAPVPAAGAVADCP